MSNVTHSSASRREFLQDAAAWAAGAGLLGADVSLSSAVDAAPKGASTAKQEKLPIVDTHQHLWDLKKFTLPWTKEAGVELMRRDFLMSDYLTAVKGQNVVKTVYMEVDVAPEQQVAEAEYVIDLCKRKDNPMVAAVISGRPASTEFEGYIRRYEGSPYIKGVRQVLHNPWTKRGYCLEPQFLKSLQLLGKLGMCFDFCMRPGEVIDAAKVAEKCPKTRFVMDHCGNLEVGQTGDEKLVKAWREGMKAFAAQPNTVCKISGIIASVKKGWKPDDMKMVIEESIEMFGEDRVYFAGDWPVCMLGGATFAEWVTALNSLVRHRTPAFRKKLFHDNAVRFYGLAKS